MRKVVNRMLFLGLIPAVGALCLSCLNVDSTTARDDLPTDSLAAADSKAIAADTKDSGEIMAERQMLDKTVWANEVEAQKYETVFIELWDRIRDAEVGNKLTVLAEFPFQDKLSLGTPGPVEKLDAGISLTTFQSLCPGHRFRRAQVHHLFFDPCGACLHANDLCSEGRP